MFARTETTTTTTLALNKVELDDLTYAVRKAVRHMKKEHLNATASYTEELLDVLIAASSDSGS
tara:strand:+ start:450 stop:638 length:189 start_codon:yes stop_codon:yes gene_type:complete